MSFLYYIEKRIEETGKTPLQAFYESKTGEYHPAIPSLWYYTYKPPEGISKEQWEKMTPEQRKQIYLTGKGAWKGESYVPKITGIQSFDYIINEFVKGGIWMTIGIILFCFLVLVVAVRGMAVKGK